MSRLISMRMMVAQQSAGICLPAVVRAQDASSQDTSVAEAARRNREKKKKDADAAKATRVITDDNLDRRNFTPGQEGVDVGAAPKLETAPPSAAAVAEQEADDKAAEQEAADQDAEIEKLKLKIVNAEKDLDLAQRQFALDQDSYLSNPAYQNDKAGKAKLDGEKQQIADHQQDVERLKTRLAALEELKSKRKPARKKAAPAAQTETPQTPTGNPPSAPPQT
jgi:hypothetical protein